MMDEIIKFLETSGITILEVTKYKNKGAIVVPDDTLGFAAAAAAFEHDVIFVSKSFWDKREEKGVQELLDHELLHLERGIPPLDLNTIQQWEDIAEWYYREEQKINSQVAPTLYSEYMKLGARHPDMFKGGVSMLTPEQCEYVLTNIPLTEEMREFVKLKMASVKTS